MRRSRLRLVVMMLRDVAIATHATTNAIRQQSSAGQRRIQKPHSQQAKPCRGRSNAILSFLSHEHPILPNDTPLRRVVVPFGSETLRTEAIAGNLRRIPIITCERRGLYRLDLAAPASQTNFMAHTYLLFDFGTDEEKAQLARHKLEGWKQAFRLDKKLQYKLERAEDETKAAPEHARKSAEAPKTEKPKAKSKAKHKSKEAKAPEETPSENGNVNLLVRLYFSGHEKLTEQRWLDRIPSEEPFKEAFPRIVRQGEEQFDEVVKQFDSLE
jgi:hypothetical protein